MNAQEARYISDSNSSNPEVFKTIRKSAEDGDYSCKVLTTDSEFKQMKPLLQSLGYDVEKFYYNWEDDPYMEISW